MTEQALSHQAGAHAALIQNNLPGWLTHARSANLKALRASQLSQQFSSGAQASWFTAADAVLRKALLASQARSRTSGRSLARTLKTLEGITEFAEPLLKAALKTKFGLELDVSQNELVHIHRESVLLGSHLRVRPTQQPLLQAALQNFDAGETFEAGSALVPVGSFVLEIVPGTEQGYPRFQYRYIQEKLSITPEDFAGVCRELDLGQRYQDHLQVLFDRTEVREKMILAHKDQMEVQVHIARMRSHISDSAYRMLLALLNGQAVPTLDRKPVQCSRVQILGVPLHDVLLIGPDRRGSDRTERCIAFIPGAPLYPVKEYASTTAFEQDLRSSLLSPDYQAFFRRFVPLSEQGELFRQLENQLFITHWSGGVKTRVANPQARLQLEDFVIEGNLFASLQQQHVARIKDDARHWAVPNQDVDRNVRLARLEYYLGLGVNLLNAAAFFLPGLGQVMLYVVGAQLMDEFFEGVHAWDVGEIDEAWAHVESIVLNVAFAAALGSTLGRPPAVKPSAFVDALEPVRLPNGVKRLHKPGLEPYERDMDIPEHIRPNELGQYTIDSKTFIRLDGKVFEQRFDSELEQWRIRHPSDDQAYQPPLLHNGLGAWRHTLEDPLAWDRRTLLRRIGHTADALTDAQLEQASQASGIDDDVLRKMHVDRQGPPPLLAETIRRFEIDLSVDQLIGRIRRGESGGEVMTYSLPLAVELPGWPADRVLRVFDGPEPWGSFVEYGADRAPNGRRLVVERSEVLSGHLPARILASLNEREIGALLGDAVSTDRSLRLQALQERLADHALARRAQVLDSIYSSTQAPAQPLLELLERDFPSLPRRAGQELIDHATDLERARMLEQGRIPLRLAEEARWYVQQVRLSRAYEGFYRDGLVSADNDRLALNLLPRLPGWPANLQLEVWEDGGGRLLDTMGGEVARIVREGHGYRAYDGRGNQLNGLSGPGNNLFAAVLHALPDGPRQDLGFALHDSEALRLAVSQLAVNDRSQASSILGLQPIKPWYRPPMRLADGRLGYPLSGRASGWQAQRRLRELYPGLTNRDRAALMQSLEARGDVATALLHLETQCKVLDATLNEWIVTPSLRQYGASEIRVDPNSKRQVANAIKRAWRGESYSVVYAPGRRINQYSLDLSGFVVGELPILTANFNHVVSLRMDRMDLASGGEDFLSRFTGVEFLSMKGNRLSRIPQAIAAMKQLRVLKLSDNAIASTGDMFDALQGLNHLEGLSLERNNLQGVAGLAQLSGLRRLTRLSLAHNGLSLSSDDIALLANLSVEYLELANNRIVLDASSVQRLAGLVRLRVLDLSNNPLALAPDVSRMSRLRQLRLSATRIDAWPTGLTELMNQHPVVNLWEIDLETNQISEVPELVDTGFIRIRQMLGLREERLLLLDDNPLTPQSVGHLRRAQVRFRTSIQQPENHAWRGGATPARLASWSELEAAPDSGRFFTVLERLTQSRDFQRTGVQLRQRVWRVVDSIAQDTDLREEVFTLAADLPETCGDAAADIFAELEIQVMVYEQTVAAGNEAEKNTGLLSLYARLFRRSAVNDLASRVIYNRISRRAAMLSAQEPLPALDGLDDINDATLRRFTVDDIEVRLAFRLGLAKRLDFPEFTQGMLYPKVAAVPPRMLDAAQTQVQALDTPDNRLAWMIEQPSWRRYLTRTYPERFNQVVEYWRPGLDYLYACNDVEPLEEGAHLDPPVLRALEQALPGIEPSVDGKLRKVSLTDEQYLTGVDRMRDEQGRAEHALLKMLTEALVS